MMKVCLYCKASAITYDQLFLHEILPDTVKRSMFVDSDAFFMTDPTCEQLVTCYFEHH